MKGKAGRLLKVGDEAATDFGGRVTLVRILQRIEGTKSQSGICFRTNPPLYDQYYDHEGPLIDADWFEPLKNTGNLL